MNVEDIVAAKVEAARRRIARERAERLARRQARAAGLAQRHAAKLRHLQQTAATNPDAKQPTTATPGLSNRKPNAMNETTPASGDNR